MSNGLSTASFRSRGKNTTAPARLKILLFFFEKEAGGGEERDTSLSSLNYDTLEVANVLNSVNLEIRWKYFH